MIEARQVTKRFDGTPVLDELDLEIGHGDRVALVGANGAGKTTLVRCLLGEYQVEGSLRVAGLEPRRDRREVLAKIGFVPQQAPPLRMSAHRLVDFTARASGCGEEPIVEAARRLGLDLESVARRPFVKLSGGQKQKLLIACALGRPCSLLFLDEPASNLDPEARDGFFSLLEERLDETTMLISSHRLDEVAALVRRVVELDLGKVILDDRVADAGALTDRLPCRVDLIRADAACRDALLEWAFVGDEAGLRFHGEIAGPDRLRFLGMAARYAGVIRHLEIGGGEGS